MPTLVRGAVTMTPDEVLGWSLRRELGTVVHPTIGDAAPEVTVQPAGPWAGRVRTFWTSRAAAESAATALAVAGGPWVLTVPGAAYSPLTVQLRGALVVEAANDAGSRWFVDVDVIGVTG